MASSTPTPPTATATPTATPPTSTPADDTTNSTSPSAAAADSSPASSTGISPDELITLIHAIKFAKTDASQRQVWTEISQELSQKPGFEFLSQVVLNDVKKVWKKALKTGGTTPSTPPPQQPQPANTNANATATPTTTDTLKSKLLQAGSKPSIYTVGQLAQEYTAMTIAEASAAEQEAMEALQGYVHAFLDVPADRSGNKPHQALISFQKQPQQPTAAGAKQKKQSSGSSTKTTKKDELPTEEIVKIQKAAPLHAGDTTSHPMLCYNQSKTRKTFLHPDSDPEGYQKIAALIDQSGNQGALAHMGGTKAYFYARITPVTNKKGKGGPSPSSIVSINTIELAPPQAW